VSSWLDRNRSLVVTVLVGLIVIALILLVLQRPGGRHSLEITFQDPRLNAASIEVYVSGAVQDPGVYPLHEGDRVQDAITAAGGGTVDADLDSLNLALRLRDQDHIVVPREGEGAVSASDPASTAAVKVDINSATAKELDALPGIGEVYSQRIVDSRESEGTFHRPEELVERKVLPQATYDKIKDLIVAGP
jgi:competence protein ComEA